MQVSIQMDPIQQCLRPLFIFSSIFLSATHYKIRDILDTSRNKVTCVNTFDQGHVLFDPHPNSSHTHFSDVEDDRKTKQLQEFAISHSVGRSFCNFFIRVFVN